MKFDNERSCGAAFAWIMSAKSDHERECRYKSVGLRIINGNIFELRNIREYFAIYQPYNEVNECCFTCKFCHMGCSWSDYGKPVKNGYFVPAKKKKKMVGDCYKIFYCPQREVGEPIHVNSDNAPYINLLSAMAIDAVQEMKAAYNKLKICREDFEKHPYYPSTHQAYIEAAKAMVEAEAFFSDAPRTLAEARSQIGYEPNKLDDMILERLEREK